MRNYFFLLLLMVTSACFKPELRAQQKNNNYTSLAKDILTLVNEHRAGMGLKPLVSNDVIVNIAEGHSKNMATKKVPFGHQGFDARVAKISKQVKPVNSFAENVLFGPQKAKEAVELWLGSEGHRKNIEGDYNQTGIGIVKSKNGDLYYTEIFVNKGN